MRKLVIANRGEIARRVLRTARARGYAVAVVSTPDDRDALVRAEADDVLEVPDFLDAAAIVAAAKRWGATVLHPGYGFLSENDAFAKGVHEAGIAFCGPTAESMRALGNKERAKRLAVESGVPTLESVPADEVDTLAARGLEAPFLVKAAGGGGGRGMRVVKDAVDLPAALERASEEAAAGFGDPTVFVERFLPEPRHIEIQVVGDGKGGGVVLGERECSLQRRFQKVIEEAPSPVVDEPLRERLAAASLALVEATRYRGAGTVEFLLDVDESFYFLEVNTRLQVEHPVTEAVFGVDLVAAQLEIAEGGWPAELERAEASGWAIEARVLAEDPRQGFLPTPGPLIRYREPRHEGVRVDSGVAEGGRVHAKFDSMIAKVIATGDDRAEATARLDDALAATVVHGTTTNLPFVQALVRHPDFHEARMSTRWIEGHLDELNRSLLPDVVQARLESLGFRESLSRALHGGAAERVSASRFAGIGNRWARVGSERERSPIHIEVVSESGDVSLSGQGLAETLEQSEVSSFRHQARLRSKAAEARRDPNGARVEAVATVLDPATLALTLFGETLVLDDPRAASHRRVRLAAVDGEVAAPMAGKVLEIRAATGTRVEEGQVLAIVESMKMQLEVQAPIAGQVERVLVEESQILDGPDLMMVIVP